MTRTFGLTGGVASGKSTVARRLRDAHHIPILDADQVARDVVAPGTPGLLEIVACFGPDVLAPDGTLDRAAMRARIAADPEDRAMLERITHPRIHNAITEWLGAQRRAGTPLVGVEASLMVETGSWRRYDALVVVSSSPETQLQRILTRDGTPEDVARALLATQLPAHRKEEVATIVLRNDGDLAELLAAADALPARLLA